MNMISTQFGTAALFGYEVKTILMWWMMMKNVMAVMETVCVTSHEFLKDENTMLFSERKKINEVPHVLCAVYSSWKCETSEKKQLG